MQPKAPYIFAKNSGVDAPGSKLEKKALNFRMYSLINKQSIVDEGPQSFVLQLDDYRVAACRETKKWIIILVNLQD